MKKPEGRNCTGTVKCEPTSINSLTSFYIFALFYILKLIAIDKVNGLQKIISPGPFIEELCTRRCEIVYLG